MTSTYRPAAISTRAKMWSIDLLLRLWRNWKRLRKIQPPERDVIFIGTVYGPEEPGARVMQRFGPINGLAGKRRLNVLFTRAKEKIITFSSMASSDITAEEHTNPGAY